MIYHTIDCGKNEIIATITLKRPDKMNALSSELVKELRQVFDEMAAMVDLKAVIIRGSDKVFAAGADINELKRINSPADAHRFLTKVHALFNMIESFPLPVVAAVSGLALGGGCELALACDIRIASESAVFGQPEINLGVIPGGGRNPAAPKARRDREG